MEYRYITLPTVTYHYRVQHTAITEGAARLLSPISEPQWSVDRVGFTISSVLKDTGNAYSRLTVEVRNRA